MLRRAKQEHEIEFSRSGAIPKDLEQALYRRFGHNAVSEVMREMEEHRNGEDLEFAAIPRPLRTQQPIWDFSFEDLPVAMNPRTPTKPPTAESVEPHGNIQNYRNNIYSEMRRSDDIPIEDIELMRRSGPCVLGARMKKAPIISALSGERKWSVNSPNNKLAMVAAANLKNLFLYHLNDILTVMDYGTLFGSLVWAERTAEQVGVTEKGVGKQSKWYVVDKLQSAHPETVQRILRDEKMHFLGFRHRRSRMKPQFANILAPQALVLTYNANFGSLYGQSLFDPAYNSWFWYEVVMRSCLRYLERMGVPVTVARAPSRGYTTRPDGTEVPNAEYALLVAGYAAHHSALYIPSDVDPQSGKELWQLDYLETDQRGEQFIAVLRFLSTQITRAMIIGDLASTQPAGDGGSYNLGSVHDKNTQVDNDQIFQNLLGQMNKYWLTRYAQFNVDYNNPPSIWLSAAVLDPLERETLMKLFATAGNVKIGEGTPLDWIDWEKAFEGVYAPVLSESERKALREQMTDEKVEAQKKFQEAQPKPQPQAANNGKQPPPKPNQPVQNIASLIAEGGLVPVLLTADQAQQLVRPAEGVLNVEMVRRPSDRVKNPEFEEKHPRDATGKFATKREVGEDEEEGEEDEKYGILDEEPWPGANPEAGLKGVFELDGVEYTILGDVSKESIVVIHDRYMQMLDRAAEMDMNIQKADKINVAARLDLDAMLKHLKWEFDEAGMSDKIDIDRMRDLGEVHLWKTGGLTASSERSSEYGMIINVDDGFADNPDYFESMVVHESLHNATRFKDESPTWGDIEESWTVLAAQDYYEKYDLPRSLGYPWPVGRTVKAAQNLGWSKSQLHHFAKLAHRLNGDQYGPMTERLWERAGVGRGQYQEAMDKWYSGWDREWDVLEDYYQFKGWDVWQEDW
jgi:hypothetical protein